MKYVEAGYIIKTLNASVNHYFNIFSGSGKKKFGPLMVAFVGIPARGKTVTAHKLARYLNWTGEVAKGKLITMYS
jgi:signal recognition particle GTPase